MFPLEFSVDDLFTYISFNITESNPCSETHIYTRKHTKGGSSGVVRRSMPCSKAFQRRDEMTLGIKPATDPKRSSLTTKTGLPGCRHGDLIMPVYQTQNCRRANLKHVLYGIFIKWFVILKMELEVKYMWQ